MQRFSDHEQVNVGSGEDMAILDLARPVSAVVNFKPEIRTDPIGPNRTPRELMKSDSLKDKDRALKIELATLLVMTLNSLKVSRTTFS